jgi:anaerobic magnesium-protoporphyrin IX monomethyl ester cyclase
MDFREITLINPPSPFLLSERVMPPLGILYVASSLKRAGIKVQFVDMADDPHAEIPFTECYGITATTPQFPAVRKILHRLMPGKIVIGGPHATVHPTECLEAGFSAVIVGEGETAIFRFLKGERGIIEEHPIKNLDKIPFPARSLVTDYHYEIDGVPAATMVTTRGCYYRKCAFCCQTWGPIRFRSAENVTAELLDILGYGYRAVMIYDDEFFVNTARDFQICWTLNRLGFIWRCFSRADLITEQVAEVASMTDCKEMLIGIESGSDTILQNISKGCSSDDNRKAIHLLYDHGIRVKAAMIIMLPGESPQTLKETWVFCEEMEPYVSDWDFTICTPYPGSAIYQAPARYDFCFDKDAIYSAYKGAGSNLWSPPKVWTSNLSFEAGLTARDKFEKRFKKHNKKVKLD